MRTSLVRQELCENPHSFSSDVAVHVRGYTAAVTGCVLTSLSSSNNNTQREGSCQNLLLVSHAWYSEKTFWNQEHLYPQSIYTFTSSMYSDSKSYVAQSLRYVVAT